jgi:hypothetical protein
MQTRTVALLLGFVLAGCTMIDVYGPNDLECLKYASGSDTVAVIKLNGDTIGVFEQWQCIEARSIEDTTKVWYLDAETGKWRRKKWPPHF